MGSRSEYARVYRYHLIVQGGNIDHLDLVRWGVSIGLSAKRMSALTPWLKTFSSAFTYAFETALSVFWNSKSSRAAAFSKY